MQCQTSSTENANAIVNVNVIENDMQFVARLSRVSQNKKNIPKLMPQTDNVASAKFPGNLGQHQQLVMSSATDLFKDPNCLYILITF